MNHISKNHLYSPVGELILKRLPQVWNSNAVKDEFMGQVVLTAAVKDTADPQRLPLRKRGRQMADEMPGSISVRVFTASQLTAIWPHLRPETLLKPSEHQNPTAATTLLCDCLLLLKRWWARRFRTEWMSPFYVYLSSKCFILLLSIQLCNLM